MLPLSVHLETKPVEAYFGNVLKTLPGNIRSAVDKTAREARREAVKVLAADANVPMASLRKAVPLIRGSKAGGPVYVATWTLGKGTNVIRAAGGRQPAFRKGTPIQASTFMVTGGGSASLSLPHGFVIIGKGGNRLVVTRTGTGRDAFKVVYAEGPATAMSQGDNVVRQTWELTARGTLRRLLEIALDTGLHGQTGGAALSSFDAEGRG